MTSPPLTAAASTSSRAVRPQTGSVLPSVETDGFGQRRKDRGGHGDLLGERPNAHPRLRHEPQHATAVDGLAGKVPALNLREFARAAHRHERALGTVPVPRTERRRTDLYQLLAIARHRIRHLGELETLRPGE